MAKKLSAREKLARKKDPKKVLLEHDFAGIKSGQLMFVGTPQIVDDYIRAIPFGETRTIVAMRNQIARRRKCDAMCPVSTAIFVRMVGEAMLEDIEDGKALTEVAPIWRLISSEDKVAKKLNTDPHWLDEQRALEQEAVQS